MDVETYSAVLMDEHRFDRLTVDAGVRYTHTWYQDYTDTTFNITGAKLASHPIVGEWGDPAFVATLGAEYEVSEPVTLYAHAAAGTVDAPPGAVSMGSADLDREERLILDGGVRVEKADLGMLQVGGFAVFRDNAVVLSETKVTEDGDTFNVYTNSDVRQYGLEIEARSVKIRDMVSGYLTATVMTSERRASGGWSDYREIPNAVVTGGVYIEVGPIDVNIFGKYVSSYENLRFAQDGRYHDLGDYFDLNLTAGWSFGKDKATRIYCSFQNLLDDEYSTVVGYPDYGLQAFIGLQHRM
jgi:outer membrane receptor protein involved in Fe transport